MSNTAKSALGAFLGVFSGLAVFVAVLFVAGLVVVCGGLGLLMEMAPEPREPGDPVTHITQEELDTTRDANGMGPGVLDSDD